MSYVPRRTSTPIALCVIFRVAVIFDLHCLSAVPRHHRPRLRGCPHIGIMWVFLDRLPSRSPNVYRSSPWHAVSERTWAGPSSRKTCPQRSPGQGRHTGRDHSSQFLGSGTPTGPVDLDHEHPGLCVPEVRPERSSRIIRTVLTFGTVLGWISGGQSLVRCHLPCPLLWRDGNRAVASCCHCP